MDMATYLRQAAPEEREALAEKAGTSVGYLYLIGGRHRRASARLCKALNAADPRLSLAELRPDIWGGAAAAGHEQHARGGAPAS